MVAWSVTVLSVGLLVLRDPLLADTYALDLRFKPPSSVVEERFILESVRNERNISLMLMSSLAEHSRTLTLQENGREELSSEELRRK